MTLVAKTILLPKKTLEHLRNMLNYYDVNTVGHMIRRIIDEWVVEHPLSYGKVALQDSDGDIPVEIDEMINNS